MGMYSIIVGGSWNKVVVTATVRRERGPEGWIQGNKVTDDE